MVERLKNRYGLEQFPETGVKYQVRFSIFKDQVVIGLDSSGEGLYKRGYRAVGWRLPLRETWRRPWCCCLAIGAGSLLRSLLRQRTIPIEAALIAKNRPRA